MAGTHMQLMNPGAMVTQAAVSTEHSSCDKPRQQQCQRQAALTAGGAGWQLAAAALGVLQQNPGWQGRRLRTARIPRIIAITAGIAVAVSSGAAAAAAGHGT